MIVGLLGWIGSGKGTAGDILSEIGFRKESFAGPVKDAVSVIFGWDRELLEGDTVESREFREQKDLWWSEKFGFTVTPRLMLQQIGTECTRKVIHDSIWISAFEKRIRETKDHIVITDVRFNNEIDFVKSLGGTLIQVKRGEDPEWMKFYYDKMVDMNTTEIHASEWEWVNNPKIDFIVENNGTKNELKKNILKILTNVEGDSILTELYL